MVIAWLFITMILVASEATPPIAKPGCNAQCGNVSIPFPFGIGSNCALDQRFEIVCKNSTTPFLKQVIELEVLYISIEENWLHVGSPITFFDCPDHKETRQPANLTKSPFYYVESNIFVAVSCGVPAMMESTLGNKFYAGCRSTCSTDNTTKSSGVDVCNDIDCCQAYISAAFYSLEISLDNYTGAAHNHECKFAFFADFDYLYSTYQNTSTSHLIKTIRNMTHVPANLSWNLNRPILDLFKSNFFMDEGTMPLSFDCEIPAFHQGRPYTYPNQTNINHCTCKSGFQGNPYLIDGCQDINECDKDTSLCHGHGVTCVNTYGSYRCDYKSKYVFIGIGSALGAVVVLFGIWCLYRVIKIRKEIKRKKRFFRQNGGLLFEQEISSSENNVEKTKLFNSNELEKATNHFSTDRILGHGGQGTVYKGMLEDGKIVAVKKSKIIDESKLLEFINEVVILSQINHRNVVKLLGCCLETEVPLLVYEFIPNGTLSQYIHNRNEECSFTWKMRLQIAKEVAGAFSYLHSAASFPIYHRDIKSTNILLDEKYRAKIADFGTSRTISLEQTHVTTLVYGTFGYLDPEYFESGQFTEKSDVYSFGVVLAELLTGQKAISMIRLEEVRSLATHFRMTIEDGGLFNILDTQVLDEAPKEEVIIVADLAHRCLHLNGRNRPTMKEVAIELEGIQKPEIISEVEENYEEFGYVETELVEPWDVVSMSMGPALDNTATQASLLLELPLQSFKSC